MSYKNKVFQKLFETKEVELSKGEVELSKEEIELSVKSDVSKIMKTYEALFSKETKIRTSVSKLKREAKDVISDIKKTDGEALALYKEVVNKLKDLGLSENDAPNEVKQMGEYLGSSKNVESFLKDQFKL